MKLVILFFLITITFSSVVNGSIKNDYELITIKTERIPLSRLSSQIITDRLRVSGGYIYRSYTKIILQNTGRLHASYSTIPISIVFVPDVRK